MKTNKKEDYLEGLFRQLPEAPLPGDFRMRIMRQVAEEAARVKKRSQRLSWLALILASLAILSLGVLAVIHLGLPRISFKPSLEALQAVPFYIYIVSPAFLLLLADHYFRKRYREKHKEQEGA